VVPGWGFEVGFEGLLAPVGRNGLLARLDDWCVWMGLLCAAASTATAKSWAVKYPWILSPNPELRLPLCLAGRNACPPEDVGGPPGHIEFLEAINNRSHEDHEQMREWCGGSFDPDAFDLDGVNQGLSGIKL
jgi:hypothetical protein